MREEILDKEKKNVNSSTIFGLFYEVNINLDFTFIYIINDS